MYRQFSRPSIHSNVVNTGRPVKYALFPRDAVYQHLRAGDELVAPLDVYLFCISGNKPELLPRTVLEAARFARFL